MRAFSASSSFCSACLDPCARGLARNGLDAADARAHRALAHDLEEPDLARGADMRASTELLAEAAKAHHAHLVTILLAKERHRPFVHGLLAGFFHDGDRIVR